MPWHLGERCLWLHTSLSSRLSGGHPEPGERLWASPRDPGSPVRDGESTFAMNGSGRVRRERNGNRAGFADLGPRSWKVHSQSFVRFCSASRP